MNDKKEICITVDENTRLVFDKEIEIVAEEVKFTMSKNSIIEISDEAIIKHSEDAKPTKTLVVSDLLQSFNKIDKGNDGFEYKQ